MQTLHIALVLEDMFPDSSGVSRSVQMQIEELVRLGHRVTLLAPAVQLVPPANAETIRLPSYRFPGLPKHTRITVSTRALAKQISREHKFDVIHSQTDTGAVQLAAHIARIQHIPHVHTFHTNMAGAHSTAPIIAFLGSIGYRLGAYKLRRIRGSTQALVAIDHTVLCEESPLGLFDWRSQALMATSVDTITTPSRYMLRYIQAAGASMHIPNASIPTGYSRSFEAIIANTRRKRTSHALRFVSVSRIVKEKRLAVVIDAFRQADIPDSELVIIGDGAELAALRAHARGDTRITFTGHVGSQQEIVQHLRDADIFILASYRFDNQPIVITEALAAGLPVLYCDDRLDVGLHPNNSLLVEPSCKALAAGMRQLANKSTRHCLSIGTKSVFRELSPEATARAYTKLYQQLLSSKKRNF